MEFSAANSGAEGRNLTFPYLPDDPRCGRPRGRSHGESQLIMISRAGEGEGVDEGLRQIKPSDRKATCLLAEGKQITLTRLGGVQNTRRLPAEYPLDSGAAFREIQGGNVFIEETVSRERQREPRDEG